MSDEPHARVLIVDDDAALLSALPQALVLRIPGVQVDTADAGTAALERVKEIEYDAIVSDIKMPGMDGLALLTAIKTLRPHVPTLLITGHGEHDLAVQALRGGAYDFIQKPIDRDYFVAALLRAIQTHHLHCQVQAQQQALATYTGSLEALVEERTRELVAANAAKDQFLSMASHELKTPLSSLKGMIQLLHRRFERANSPDLKSIVVMERSVRRMEVLVEDLLCTSLLEMELLSMRRRRCNLRDVCTRVVEEYLAAAHPEPILRVTLQDTPIEAEVDEARIEQVLLNLLSNARKYSPLEAPILLTLARRGDEATIAIHDQGVGISEDQLPHIFERFYRSPDSEVQTGSSMGFGLGLYISRSIVHQHNGRIEVESKPGQGSTFTVVLPLLPVSENAMKASSSASYDSSPQPQSQASP